MLVVLSDLQTLRELHPRNASGDELRQQREMAGLSVVTAAVTLGVTPRELRAIEAGWQWRRVGWRR